MKIIPLLILIACGTVTGQSLEERKGNVSFISSQNIYVKFSSTGGIEVGDTLYSGGINNLIPVLIAKYISATSIAGELINGGSLKINDAVYARVPVKTDGSEDSSDISEEVQIPQQKIPGSEKKSMQYPAERISGRFSVNSFSSYSNLKGGDYQRFRYTLTLDGRNIGESPLSVKSHLNFNYRTDEWKAVSNNPARNLRVYEIAIMYKFSPHSEISAGRHLNGKITNIGPVDGIQFNHSLGFLNAGIFAGSRPEFSDLGFNLKLLQYGIYLNRTDTTDSRITDNTIAFVNQTNNRITDRRMLYFQHTNNFFSSLSFFLSAEADLYKKINEKSSSQLSLTGFFLSVRYNPFPYASLNLSYDARRNIIYYESYKNFLETLLDNEMRQGFRGSINIRPFASLYAGINTGYRFRNGDPRPSNDFGAYLNYINIPYLDISPSLSYTRIKSSFLSGEIYGATVTRYLDFFHASLSLAYRNSQYSLQGILTSVQNSFTADINAKISRHLYLSSGWEGIFEGKNTSGRILFSITSRL